MKEFKLLEHVYRSNALLGAEVLIPPGDDMAMIEIDGARVLAAVDQLVAGRHFDVLRTPIELIGRKAMTRSLSDIAAMAAKPLASLVAVTLPPDFGDSRARALFDAMRETAARYRCPLIGGDIAFHETSGQPLVCSVTVLGSPATKRSAVTRAGARPGDRIYVTGQLGGAIGSDGLGRHLTFEPRINEAIALTEKLGENLHAMIDISDGLGRDASHITEQSGVRIEIDAAAIPTNDNIAWKRAVSEGEDYELCFAAIGDVPDRVGDVPITEIGIVRDRDARRGPPYVVFHDGEERIAGDQLGWQHESFERGAPTT